MKILDFGAGKGHMAQRIGDQAKLLDLEPSELIFPMRSCARILHL